MSRPELVTWRQGRCLPYGDGITFWALGEIVKAEAGSSSPTRPTRRAAKLERALPDDEPDGPGCGRASLPLVGVERRARRAGGVVRGLAAFCESLAERAVVFVFEDLHWADPALLAFLEHLADWARGRAAARRVHGPAGAP